MFTVLADAMYAATLARRGSNIPDNLKDYADRHVSKHDRTAQEARATLSPYKQLW